ncbi:fibronectin type III domain-containing protein [bacterium]|nr:fibronectin type III domain-containing protein [candidate division CSSED10-310 bacterium]
MADDTRKTIRWIDRVRWIPGMKIQAIIGFMVMIPWTGYTQNLPEAVPAPAGEKTVEMIEPVPIRMLPPSGLLVTDVPEDDGRSVLVSWQAPESDPIPTAYILEMETEPGVWETVGLTRYTEYQIDELDNNVLYRFRVGAQYNGDTYYAEEAAEGMARDHWFKLGEIPVLVAILTFTLMLVGFLTAAKRGIPLFVRRISGLNAVEDAIGRATEMGRPVLYIPGTSTIEDVATLASLNILGEVCRRTVHYDVRIICPNIDPLVFTIAQEIVKETYSSEGRPDAYNPDQVFFMVPEQFAYAAGVNGIMVRERPATIFLLGMFWAESLIMAETGAMTGAIQIAGTDEVSQLPFFITACDYTLIGEELYAASAYLAREPMLLGTLKTQDYFKLLFLIVMVVFTLLALIMGWPTDQWVMVR